MTDTTDKTKRRNLTDAEHFKAMSLLHEHLRTTDKPDEWVYADHYSDQRLADTIGCTLNNIVGLRERAFGRLAKAVEFVRDPRVEHLIAAHNEFVRDITNHLNGDLTDQFDPAPYLIGEPS